MKIAILGVHGFIGRNLSELLLNNGHEITGYVLDHELERGSQFECKSVTKLLRSKFTEKFKYDVTINLAARRSTRSQPLTESQVNEFTYEIPKEFILRTTSPQTLVLNACTYIQNYKGFTGQSVDSYGAAKERISTFLKKESLVGRFTTKDLFFFTLYGPGDQPNHLVPLLLNAARTGAPISLSPGHQLMNLMYVDDAARNILKSISYRNNGSYVKYYLWSDDYLTVRQLVLRIQSATGQKINCRWGDRDYVGHEMMEPWPIPMQQLPEFEASISLEEGITRTWKAIETD